MNYNQPDRYGSRQERYQTHHSERNRHPGRSSQQYRFDDYGDSAHGGYGNESYSGTWGNQGNEGAGSRNVANRGMSTYSTSQNYGNMGSYGGAQGFGSTRAGYSSQRTSHPGSQFDSGHGRSPYATQDRDSDQPRRYGYQSDYDSHGQSSNNYRYDRNELILYGGSVHFSKDVLPQPDGSNLFGRVVELNENGWSDPVEGINLVSLSQEHGIVKATPEQFAKYKVGDIMYILPIHSCLTADIMKSYLMMDGERLEHLSGLPESYL